jgi:hypothetical protein
MKQRVISIVGKGPGCGLAPRKGNVWVINNGWIGNNPSLIIDMHNLDWTVDEILEHYKVHLAENIALEELRARAERSHKSYQMTKEFCRQNNIPIMSQKTYGGIKGWEFPLDTIIQKFDCDLFTSGVCYAIAYAIFKKAARIDLYGVNCIKDEEWYNLREGVMLWIGIAKGKMIKVTVTGLEFRPLRAYDKRLYGYNIPQPPKGMPEEDIIENFVTKEVQHFAVWREM